MFRFSIDRGGTFTDIIAEVSTCLRIRLSDSHTARVLLVQVPADPPVRVLKLLSVDPAHYKDAPTGVPRGAHPSYARPVMVDGRCAAEGIRRILQEVTGKPHPIDQPVRARVVFSAHARSAR